MDLNQCCEYCHAPFDGRSNRLYCSPRCKSAINNQRTAKREKEAKNMEALIRKNRRILVQLHNLFGNNEIPSVVVDRTQFDSDYNNGISPTYDTIRILDYSIKRLENTNYLINKIL